MSAYFSKILWCYFDPPHICVPSDLWAMDCTVVQFSKTLVFYFKSFSCMFLWGLSPGLNTQFYGIFSSLFFLSVISPNSLTPRDSSSCSFVQKALVSAPFTVISSSRANRQPRPLLLPLLCEYSFRTKTSL